jgi:hypothetical protein
VDISISTLARPYEGVEKTLEKTMRSIKDCYLIVLAISLSVVIVLVRELRIADYLTLETQRAAAYLTFGLNVIVAIAGLWNRRFCLAWLLYLVLSLSSMLFLSASTPFTAVWLLINYWIQRYYFG